MPETPRYSSVTLPDESGSESISMETCSNDQDSSPVIGRRSVSFTLPKRLEESDVQPVPFTPTKAPSRYNTTSSETRHDSGVVSIACSSYAQWDASASPKTVTWMKNWLLQTASSLPSGGTLPRGFLFHGLHAPSQRAAFPTAKAFVGCLLRMHPPTYTCTHIQPSLCAKAQTAQIIVIGATITRME